MSIVINAIKHHYKDFGPCCLSVVYRCPLFNITELELFCEGLKWQCLDEHSELKHTKKSPPTVTAVNGSGWIQMHITAFISLSSNS